MGKRDGPKEIGFELVHPSVGEQQGGVVLGHQGGGRDHLVVFGLEEVQIGLSNFATGGGNFHKNP
jgi:hypothetical protein